MLSMKTDKSREGLFIRVLLKYGMGTFRRTGAKWACFFAKWGQNGQFLGEMGMFHIAIAYNPHANTSLTLGISNK